MSGTSMDHTADRTLLPNATQFPNALTDQVMPLVSGNEWKVIHYAVRYAIGHRSADTLTPAQIAHGRQAEDGAWTDRGTGIDEAEVKECLAFLCDEVHLFLREDRPRKPHGYRLNLDLSSINWPALEQRQGAAQPAEQPVEAAPAPPPVAPRRPRREAAGPFVEKPTSNVRLEMSGGPALEQFNKQLGAEEAHTFSQLVAMAQKANIGLDDDIWPLYLLWRSYGFRRVQNAFQSPEPVMSWDNVGQSCLVGTVIEQLEVEKFGQITQVVRDKIMAMTEDWKRLEDWQEAIRSAVLYNSRRLATVEKNLKRLAAPDAQSQGETAHAGSAAPAQSRKRTPRRASDYSEEELRAIREAEGDGDWAPPPR